MGPDDPILIMSKRTFEHYKQGQRGNEQDIKSLTRQQRVHDVLSNGKANIFRALKVARGFERQKLGRRQKTAKQKKAGISLKRLQEEVDALKSLELEEIAESHLFKKILRIKSVASSGLLPSYVTKLIEETRKTQSTASANVQARLFNTTPAKTALNETVDNVRRYALNTQDALPSSGEASGSGDKVKQLPTASDTSESEDELGSDESFERSRTIGKGEPGGEVDYGEGEEVDGGLLNQFEERIAHPDDSDTVDPAEEDRHSGSEWSGADSGSAENEDAASEEKDSKPSPERNLIPANAIRPKPKSTTFLPTLATGGYWSGSEQGSDADDTAGQIQRRKNKRGQRARQAIYEKKYGDNANHLKKAKESRDHGWDMRRGAQKDKDVRNGKKARKFERPNRGKVEKLGNRRGPQSSGANIEPVKPRTSKAAEGAIHPSWEAARKAKEQKNAAPFQGKKVTFD